ncbi:DnaA regulatory inactivator Hda [Dokdonella sp.]|uniref:DnaA regulatory inactivator Hda n=1 Tax=Dokdonella sp. TaxID=2291710 RepID=UPI003528EB58
MNRQLPLALPWPAHQRFESFLAGANAAGVDILRRAAHADGIDKVFLAGPGGSGKTHLLIAACAEASSLGRRAQYLDPATVSGPLTEAIRQFGGSDMLAIDDVDLIAGSAEAEHALFDLHNRCVAEGTTLLFAASDPPAALPLVLPDLTSRLSACTQWQLRALDETSRREALRERAASRGIELDQAVLDWLFTRRARDLGALTELLDQIDLAALAAKRRVTVPFLRELLENVRQPDEPGS